MAHQSYPPPAYQADSMYNVSEHHTGQSYAVELPAHRHVSSRASNSGNLTKPIVVPQTTNMFYIRSFSPFARAYPPALADLPNPISQEEFLEFLDGLNNAHMAHPFFQAGFMAGGMVMSAPLLPVQLAGGGLQLMAAVASAGVTITRSRKFMKKANETIFAPRGLVCKVMFTKGMMRAVGFNDPDTNGKLKLPPLNEVNDLEFYTAGQDAAEQMPEDPRMRRLRALDGYVSPLSFDVTPEPTIESAVKRYSTAPARWLNSKNVRKMIQMREKGLKQSRDKKVELDTELAQANREIAELERLAEAQEAVEIQLKVNRAASSGQTTDAELAANIEKRNRIVAEIKAAGEKKIRKADRKEERIANRILWVVITRAEWAVGGEDLELTDTESR